LNLRPPGYEPDELPGCSTPRQTCGLLRHIKRGRRKLDSGGDDRDRTGDLLLAKQALSQLSYAPVNSNFEF
jgi:hypothetical protein